MSGEQIYGNILGFDANATLKSFDNGYASGLAKIARGEIQSKLQNGDYAGAAQSAFGYGDNAAGSQLAQIAQSKMAMEKAQADKQAVAQALQGALPQNLQGLAQANPNLAVEMFSAQQNNDYRNKNFNADEAYRQSQLTLDQQRLAASQQKTNEPPNGYQWSQDGSLAPIKGGPADPTRPMPNRALRPTTDQTNAAGFFDRMTQAEQVLANPDVVNAAISYSGKAKANLPFGIGNYMADPNYQQYDQASRNFINAVLRKESGAAISPSEFENANVQYFPQPGDTPQKLALKAQNRATAINSMKRAAAGVLQGDQNVNQSAPVPQPNENAGANIFNDISQFQEGDIFADENGNTFTIMNGQQVPVTP